MLAVYPTAEDPALHTPAGMSNGILCALFHDYEPDWFAFAAKT